VPAAILGADRDEARRRFGVAPEARCLLAMGGSQGARSINQATIEAFAEAGSGGPDAEFRRDFHVIHLSGRRDYEDLQRRLTAAPHAEDYTLLPYEPDLSDVLAACDLVLARSGGSIFEVVAAGRPAILVPYPYATADHQAANAAWMSEARAAETIADDSLSAPLLAGRVSSLFEDEAQLAAMSAASAALARPDAARIIADEVLLAAGAPASGAPYMGMDHKRRTGT
jgi:UDP-N-acetylglucosamine--N-acetylmuramyl-(pentapeptide) pyrophosphoryl-undecaprenol N-acetylglucosamine transferase